MSQPLYVSDDGEGMTIIHFSASSEDEIQETERVHKPQQKCAATKVETQTAQVNSASQDVSVSKDDHMVSVDEPCPICGESWNGKRFMIRCDMCSRWVHKSCLGIDGNDLSDLQRFWCWHCDIPPQARHRAVTIGSDKNSRPNKVPRKQLLNPDTDQRQRGVAGPAPTLRLAKKVGKADHDENEGNVNVSHVTQWQQLAQRPEQHIPPKRGARVLFKWNDREWYEGTLLQRKTDRDLARPKVRKGRRTGPSASKPDASNARPEWWTVQWDHGGRSRIRLDESTSGRWKILEPHEDQGKLAQGITVTQSGFQSCLSPGAECLVRDSRPGANGLSQKTQQEEAEPEQHSLPEPPVSQKLAGTHATVQPPPIPQAAEQSQTTKSRARVYHKPTAIEPNFHDTPGPAARTPSPVRDSATSDQDAEHESASCDLDPQPDLSSFSEPEDSESECYSELEVELEEEMAQGFVSGFAHSGVPTFESPGAHASSNIGRSGEVASPNPLVAGCGTEHAQAGRPEVTQDNAVTTQSPPPPPVKLPAHHGAAAAYFACLNERRFAQRQVQTAPAPDWRVFAYPAAGWRPGLDAAEMVQDSLSIRRPTALRPELAGGSAASMDMRMLEHVGHGGAVYQDSREIVQEHASAGDFCLRVKCKANGMKKGTLEGLLVRSKKGLGVPVIKYQGKEYSLTAFEEMAGNSARRPRTTILLASTGQPIGAFLETLGV